MSVERFLARGNLQRRGQWGVQGSRLDSNQAAAALQAHSVSSMHRVPFYSAGVLPARVSLVRNSDENFSDIVPAALL
jgi:hypothetical protein